MDQTIPLLTVLLGSLLNNSTYPLPLPNKACKSISVTWRQPKLCWDVQWRKNMVLMEKIIFRILMFRKSVSSSTRVNLLDDARRRSGHDCLHLIWLIFFVLKSWIFDHFICISYARFRQSSFPKRSFRSRRYSSRFSQSSFRSHQTFAKLKSNNIFQDLETFLIHCILID
jgi:hypothetical protein